MVQSHAPTLGLKKLQKPSAELPSIDGFLLLAQELS
jgi:hypothetical protein